MSTTAGGPRMLPPAAQQVLSSIAERTTTAPAGAGKRAPCWRKSKADQVDQKIEKLFEAYKVIDEKNAHLQKEGLLKQEDPARVLRKNYFPDESDWSH